MKRGQSCSYITFIIFNSIPSFIYRQRKRIVEERGLENIPVISYDERLQALRNLADYKKKSLINIISPSKIQYC